MKDHEWEAENSTNTDGGWSAPTCLTCKWWARHAANITTSSNARCHRRAPVPVLSTFMVTEDEETGEEKRQWTGYIRQQWPITEANDWCGEHERGPIGA